MGKRIPPNLSSSGVAGVGRWTHSSVICEIHGHFNINQSSAKRSQENGTTVPKRSSVPPLVSYEVQGEKDGRVGNRVKPTRGSSWSSDHV